MNLALEDSLQLSKAIVSAAESNPDNKSAVLDQKVAEFEQDMFKRAKKTQQLTYKMMQMWLQPGAPREGIETYLCTAAEDELGWWITNFLMRPICYIYFFVFRLIW